MMKILLAFVSPRALPRGPFADLLASYEKRSNRYASCGHRSLPTESSLLSLAETAAGRTRSLLWLADSRGQQMSSEELAAWLGSAQDQGAQHLVVGIGPADGWSPAALARADRTLAFGRITLPHELATVVAAEQIYRALTIRAGHPYHSGH